MGEHAARVDPRSRGRRLGVWMIVGLFGSTIVAIVVVTQASSAGDDAGDRDGVPTVSFALLDGGEATVADTGDGPVVLNFFASWCPPCVAEMPDLEAMHQQFGDRVAFVGISTQDRIEDTRQLIESTGVSYPVGLDPTGEVFVAFGGFAMPTTVFITADNQIAELHTGILNRDDMVAKIADLLD